MTDDLPPRGALDNGQRLRPATMAGRVFDALRGGDRPVAGPSQAIRCRRPKSPAASGVSRQPVREAFIKLAEAGLVEVRPQRGTFVRLICEKREVANARFIREAIEVAIVRRAAAGAPADDIAALEALIAEQQAGSPRRGDNVAFLRPRRAVPSAHRTAAPTARRPGGWSRGLKAQLDRVRYLSLPGGRAARDHHRAAPAYRSRHRGRHSPEQAEQAMKIHLREILKSLPRLAREFPDMFERQRTRGTRGAIAGRERRRAPSP